MQPTQAIPLYQPEPEPEPEQQPADEAPEPAAPVGEEQHLRAARC